MPFASSGAYAVLKASLRRGKPPKPTLDQRPEPETEGGWCAATTSRPAARRAVDQSEVKVLIGEKRILKAGALRVLGRW